MKRVAQYDPESGALLAVYQSLAAEAESVYRGRSSNICACCKGRAKTAYGYVWKYHKEGKEK